MFHVDHKFVVAGESVFDVVAATYGVNKVNYNNPEYISRRSLMCPKNDTTEYINQYVMKLIPGVASTLLSVDAVGEEQAAMYPAEFLNYNTPNGLPPHRLYRKVYASIISLRSLEPTQGICNGTRLTVKAFMNRIIHAKVARGTHKSKLVYIARIPMTPSDFPFVLRRREFPIRPAFCITINKGQGQSLENVGIFLPSPNAIFSHGQLYVALSRVKNPAGLKPMVCGGSPLHPVEPGLRM